uniref:DUF7437 domain-containing protein n=1 Tax=Natronorubrum halophilum TaxID=1702106 RepID=UPI001EE88F15|nr:hypothetical protein [Natronorubrum halophilum]
MDRYGAGKLIAALRGAGLHFARKTTLRMVATDIDVRDTEAIIAYLYDEPGRSVVEEYLRDVRDGAVEGLLAETNAGEIL